jgi:hypothetical protein
MTSVTLQVPDDMLAAARQIAEATARPVEEVLLTRLKKGLPLPVLAPDEEAELEALHQLSDDALWTIAREQMPDDLQAEMTGLMDRNARGTITPDEHARLQALVERGQRLMVRKSEASAILTRRGHNVTPEALASRE